MKRLLQQLRTFAAQSVHAPCCLGSMYAFCTCTRFLGSICGRGDKRTGMDNRGKRMYLILGTAAAVALAAGSIGMQMPKDVYAATTVPRQILYAQPVSAANQNGKLCSAHAGNRLDGNGKKMYDFLKGRLEQVASGEENATQFVIPVKEFVDKLKYTEKELGVTFYDAKTHALVSKEKQSKILNQFMEEKIISDEGLQILYSSILADFPYELYWYDKAAEGSFGIFMSGARIQKQGGRGACLSMEKAVLTFGFLVSDAYGNRYETDPDQIKAARKAVANADRIVREAAGLSDYQKLAYYCRRICELNSYNKEAAETKQPGNQNPWQMIYVFDEDDTTNVVCEGYAKAFQYLCDQTAFADPDIYSCLVTGTMTGATGAGLHMWNVVHMGDQGNYLVDVTNCDEGTAGAGGALFLAGAASGNTADGYQIKIGRKSVWYQYREDMAKIYSKEDLTLAIEKTVGKLQAKPDSKKELIR